MYTSIQSPGLMKMRLMHHQEHHQGYKAPQTNHDVVCQPQDVTLPHEQLHGVSAEQNKAGHRSRTHCMAGHSERKASLIMPFSEEHAACTSGTSARPGGPNAPAQLNCSCSITGSEWAPILKRSNVCMQRALRGCHPKVQI